MQEISVEVPDGSVLIEKSYKFIHGIYKQEIDDENRSPWVMDNSKGKVLKYILEKNELGDNISG